MNLYPYQVKGVEHLLSNPFGKPHALLADSPGTGKTIMTIEAAKQSNCKTGLIICPAIIKEQWAKQMVKWDLCAEDEIQVIYGRDATVNGHPWVIVNYDLVREASIRSQLLKRKWHMLTLDEAQRLKSHSSKQSHAVFNKNFGIGNSAYYKWALSGTIMPNRPSELYPILKTMAPDVLGKYNTWSKYIQRYCGGAAAAGRGASNIPEITESIQPFMLRRELKDVWRDCPELLDNTIWLDVPFETHPEWIGSGFMYESTERRIVAEAKAPYVGNYIQDRLESGITKIVCFTYHRSVIETLSKQLHLYNPALIYGGIARKKREENIAKFLTDSTCQLFFIQIGSGGEGLDGLQEVCNECIEAEPEWSPGREDQAVARVLRLGQTKPVILTRILASRSYEEVIYKENRRKRSVINVVLKPNGGTFFMSIEANIERIVSAQESIAESLFMFRPVVGIFNQLMQAAMGQNPEIVALQNKMAKQVATTPIQFAPPLPPGGIVPNDNGPGVVALNVPPATPALAAAPNTTDTTNTTLSRKQFEDKVVATFQPRGTAGFDALTKLLGEFGIQRLSELPEVRIPEFLSKI